MPLISRLYWDGRKLCYKSRGYTWFSGLYWNFRTKNLGVRCKTLFETRNSINGSKFDLWDWRIKNKWLLVFPYGVMPSAVLFFLYSNINLNHPVRGSFDQKCRREKMNYFRSMLSTRILLHVSEFVSFSWFTHKFVFVSFLVFPADSALIKSSDLVDSAQD